MLKVGNTFQNLHGLSDRNLNHRDERKNGRKQVLNGVRAQVLELSSQGFSDREIASKLQVGALTVYRDLDILEN